MNVLSGPRNKRARHLYLVTMVTVRAMRRKRRQASHPKNQVYLKVVFLLCTQYVHMKYTRLSRAVKNIASISEINVGC